MQTKALKIGLIGIGLLLLAIGLWNTVPDIWHFTYSNTYPATLIINNIWPLMVVCGVVLCCLGFFIKMKKG